MVVGGGGYYAAKDVNFKMTMGIINTKYSVVRARELTSFGRERVGKCDSHRHSESLWLKQVIKCKKFYHSAFGRGLNLLHYK